MYQGNYVLVTPARNEAMYITGTMESVVSQTLLPRRWVIVSDGSTDETDAIVSTYARRYPFITLLRRDAPAERNFTSKVFAFNAGYALLTTSDFSYIGNLDADITFEPDYFETLLSTFDQNPSLGVAGGAIYELRRNVFCKRSENRKRNVAGAVQMFRRKCFEDIHGFVPLRFGGEDTVATLRARMNGWETQEIASLRVCHHRTASTALGGGVCFARLREGQRDKFMGVHPVYAVCKFVRRLGYRPLLLGSFLTLAGYIFAAVKDSGDDVPADVRKYMRNEELLRLKGIADGLVHGSFLRGRRNRPADLA